MKLFKQLVIFIFCLCVGHSSLAADEIQNMVITVTVEQEGGGENAYTDKLISEEEQVSGISGTDNDSVHPNTQGTHEPAIGKEPYVDETRPFLHMRVMPEK